MAVTILERPEGHIIDPIELTGAAIESGIPGIVAINTTVNHGLSTGEFVYIVSPIGEYNGFFEIEVTAVNQFRLYQSDGVSQVAYIQDTSDVTWYKTTVAHGWSCVHLPITYRLSSDLYPTNSVDTTRNITSVQDANGYTVILLSGSLGSGVNSYDFVKITAPSDTELSKVYQIVEFISPTVMIINLAYDAANNFTGATALKHYNNYNIIVRVYAGINASHSWAAQKPYELAATLLYVPDDNNEAHFSINELLKSYIETRNNLILGTLPNNIDFWTNFYIEVAESYDDSDGYTFGTFTSNYTSDQSTFEGTAINAKLEFKNIYSGSLSEYLMTNNTAKFLTLMTLPVFFAGCSDDNYFDLSYLLDYDSLNATEFKIEVNGVKTTLPDYGSGVYRSSIQMNNLSVVKLYMSAVNDVVNGTFNTNLDGWTEVGSGQVWSYNAAPGAAEVTMTGVQESKARIQAYPIVSGATYAYDFEVIVSSIGADNFAFVLFVSDNAGTTLQTVRQLTLTNGTHIISGTYTATANGQYLGFKAVTVTP